MKRRVRNLICCKFATKTVLVIESSLFPYSKIVQQSKIKYGPVKMTACILKEVFSYSFAWFGPHVKWTFSFYSPLLTKIGSPMFALPHFISVHKTLSQKKNNITSESNYVLLWVNCFSFWGEKNVWGNLRIEFLNCRATSRKILLFDLFRERWMVPERSFHN